jgi:hypothetical protein
MLTRAALRARCSAGHGHTCARTRLLKAIAVCATRSTTPMQCSPCSRPQGPPEQAPLKVLLHALRRLMAGSLSTALCNALHNAMQCNAMHNACTLASPAMAQEHPTSLQAREHFLIFPSHQRLPAHPRIAEKRRTGEVTSPTSVV